MCFLFLDVRADFYSFDFSYFWCGFRTVLCHFSPNFSLSLPSNSSLHSFFRQPPPLSLSRQTCLALSRQTPLTRGLTPSLQIPLALVLTRTHARTHSLTHAHTHCLTKLLALCLSRQTHFTFSISHQTHLSLVFSFSLSLTLTYTLEYLFSHSNIHI